MGAGYGCWVWGGGGGCLYRDLTRVANVYHIQAGGVGKNRKILNVVITVTGIFNIVQQPDICQGLKLKTDLVGDKKARPNVVVFVFFLAATIDILCG